MTKLQALLRANPNEEPSEIAHKLLTRLQGFVPDPEGRALIEASFDWVSDFELEEELQRRVDEQINEAWSVFVLLTVEGRAWFYDAILNALEKESFSYGESARKTAKLTELFAMRKASLESSYALREELRVSHSRILNLLTEWIAKGTEMQRQNPAFAGLSHAAASLFGIYFNHPHYMDDDDLRSEAALLLPQLIRTFYPACNHIHIYMLGYHNNYDAEIARMIDFYIRLDQPVEEKGKAYYSLASSFMGENSPVLERGIEPVLDELAPRIETWSDEQFDEFIDTFVFCPLLRQPLFQIARSKDRQLVLELIIAQNRKTEQSTKVSDHLNKALVIVAQIEADSMPQGEGGVKFADFNFKLAVIEELMYKQNVLKPRFDVVAFAQEYALREISIAEEGDRPIPEVREYFERLVLTEQDLAHVTKLVIGSGQQAQLQIVPFWNGEGSCFDVHTLEDLRHLPNLRVLQIVKLLKADLSPALERDIILVQD
ncbi:DUF6892 domain-containing protein [Saccharibacillus kuerlensis]|uniref:DUF6892 domain-containing protein n=1 Tax=Saccharibacillus kuerlensis TaxID=459527 RepID=A0ABQ2L429_9BACL|nr:hypothetical protein [Saccharibacillus kuerlensis]GGO02111.1 hypothetical protein GCM10010969_25100 [Saccharibacillus kuerlensis]